MRELVTGRVATAFNIIEEFMFAPFGGLWVVI
jgi:hypothetical protein